MKKILAFAIGLGIALGTVSFAQDTTQTPTKKMQKKKKTDKTDTTSTTTRSSFPGWSAPGKPGQSALPFPRISPSSSIFPSSVTSC